MMEAQSWTTHRSGNPRLETSIDIPSTPTGEVRSATSNNMTASSNNNILTAMIISLWYFSNIGVIILNKYLLSVYDYTYPIFLTILHMISCTICSFITIRCLKIVPFQQISSPKQFLKIFALSTIFSFSIVCGNISLKYLPVSFNQAIGATTPFFTALLHFVITRKTEPVYVYLALVPVVSGIVLASNSEPSFHKFGFVICVAATAARALKTVVQGLLLTSDSEKLDAMNLLLYMAPLSAMILLPFSFYIEGNVFAMTVEKAREDLYIVFLLIGNALVAYLVNLTNFLVTKHTSALTLQVLGNLKGFVAAMVSVLIFKNTVTAMGIFGYVVTIIGTVLYGLAKKGATLQGLVHRSMN